MTRRWTCLMAAATIGSCTLWGADWPEDPEWREYYVSTQSIKVPTLRPEKVFRASEQQANFTLFKGVDKVHLTDGALQFNTRDDTVLLGWGNCLGAQPLQDIQSLWYRDNTVVIRLKQSCEQSTWNGKFWVDGTVVRKGDLKTHTVKGTDWQEVTLTSPPLRGPIPDGLELTVDAAPGTEFRIEWIKFVQERAEGYIRTDFEIPEGRIWKAVAQVGSANQRYWSNSRMDSTLYINGRRVERVGARGLYATRPVDIEPYLKPGRNAVGMYGFRTRTSNGPFMFFQATIVMESGETVTVNTGDPWAYAPEAEEGWSKPGFDDTGWEAAAPGPGLWHTMQWMPPAHEGLLRLRRPERRTLAYGSENDIHVVVETPQGLADADPRVQYRFCRALKDGTAGPVIREGTLPEFSEENGSLVYRVNLGRSPSGIYTLALRLVDAHDAILDEHPREPLLVAANRPLPHTACASYTDGIDMELEQEIDFTDPEGARPWIEGATQPGTLPARVAEPTIVRKDGLVYREVTGRNKGSYISYRLGEFAHPGDFYLFDLTYPDNGERGMHVSVSQVDGKGLMRRGFVSQAGVGAEVGGSYFNTGDMRHLRWVHVADSGVHSLDIKTLYDGWPAAVGSLKVYHVKGSLPSAGAGTGRRYGIHTERQYYGNGFGRVFGCDSPSGWPPAKKHVGEEKDVSWIQDYVRDLVWLLAASEKYTQYLKFAGQNATIMGCFQYNDSNTPYIPADFTSRVPRCPRSVLANVLDMNGIDFLAGVQFSNAEHLKTYANNAAVAGGADTVWMIDAEGKQFYGISISTVAPNWMHPEFARCYLQLLRNLTSTFGQFDHFQGVSNISGISQRSPYYFPAYGLVNDHPLHFSYDDLTFRMFREDTGVDLVLDQDDPDRFSKRAALVQAPRVRRKFLDWRAEKLTDFYRQAVQCVRQHRPALRYLNLLEVERVAVFEDIYKRDLMFKDFMQDYAIDIPALGTIEHMVPVRWTLSWRARQQHQNPYCWIPRERRRVLDAFSGLGEQGVLCRTSWIETRMHCPASLSEAEILDSDWMMERVTHRTQPQAGGAHCRQALIQAVITGDPQWLFTGYTDVMLNIGHEQAIRKIMRVFTHLPREPFTRILDTDLTSMLALRKLTRGDRTWVYVANPGYWPVKGSIRMKTGGPVHELPEGNRVAGAGDVQVNVELPPYGLAAYEVHSGALTVAGYDTDDIPSAERDYLAGILARVSTLLNDDRVRIVLPPEDRDRMQDITQRARDAVRAGEYALAWNLVREPGYWIFWRDFLEKAAASLALLPDNVDIRESAPGPGDTGTESALRVLQAARSRTPILIDGIMNEAAWQRTPFSGGFRTRGEGFPALNQTGVKAAYDDENLYIGFICADRSPDRIKGEAQEERRLWAARDDALAMFIQPDETKPVYYQMAFNPAGTRFDQKIKGGDRDYDFAPAWEAAASRADRCWTAEVKLPYAAFGLEGRGERSWRVNFFRVMRDNDLPPAEWCTSPEGWHTPSRFGKLRFDG